MTERDYSEEFNAEFEMYILSEVFGFNHKISLEVSTCEYHNKYCNYVRHEKNAKMDFH